MKASFDRKCPSLSAGVQFQIFIIAPEKGPILYTDIIEKGVAMSPLVREVWYTARRSEKGRQSATPAPMVTPRLKMAS